MLTITALAVAALAFPAGRLYERMILRRPKPTPPSNQDASCAWPHLYL